MVQGCGKKFHQEKDDYYSETNLRWNKVYSICGETFDENGRDFCEDCELKKERKR